ncbi:MAG: DNA cytosine methyltransferase [Desulfurococcales archaeon]|nr:DNA cytosine methyltransferase [Desulfurococcales archaeon]
MRYCCAGVTAIISSACPSTITVRGIGVRRGMARVIKILDLFAGMGGVAKGIQGYLDKLGLDYEYIAVDIDPIVLKLHKEFNPKSIVIRRDAYSFTVDELMQYDFIWASPPCQSHSKLNAIRKRFNPDHRLWYLIHRLYNTYRPFVVENVQLYYKPLFKPKTKIGRHLFWSNLPITDKCSIHLPYKELKMMNIHDLIEYHKVPTKILIGVSYMRKRKYLRNMVHYSISYCIMKQVCKITQCFNAVNPG